MKIKVYVLHYDIHNSGSGVELFGTRDELRLRLREIIEEDCDGAEGPEVDQIKALLAKNKIDEAWHIFADWDNSGTHPRHCDDWYSDDEHDIEVPADEHLTNALEAAVERMEAVAESIPVHNRHEGVSQAKHVAHMAGHLAQHAKKARAALEQARAA